MDVTDRFIIKVTIPKNRFHEQATMVEWCKNTLGPGGWNTSLVLNNKGEQWRVDSIFGSTHFWFKQERDYLLFALKWL